jgi:D-glycero-D-manno-heptose 1,7-bisphosphate phosphatase
VTPGGPLRPAVFLDRDGVIVEDTHHLHRREDVRFIPGALNSITEMNKLGYPVVLITNQAGIGRGYYD